MKVAILTAIIFITAEFVVYGSPNAGWGSFALLCGSFVVSVCIAFTYHIIAIIKDSSGCKNNKYFNEN